MPKHTTLSWAIIGYLNVICASWEKFGGSKVSLAKTSELHIFLTENALVEVNFQGNVFTWYNRSYDGVWVKERLDRVITNVEWLYWYPNSVVVHESFRGSDHCPIILFSDPKRRKPKIPFRFEAGWNEIDECREIINKEWSVASAGSRMFQVSFSLKRCKDGLLD